MSLPTFIAVIVLVVGVPLNFYVAVRLWRLHRARPGLRVVRERWIVSTVVLVIVVVFGLIFLNNDQIPPFLTTDVTKIITRLAILILSILPASYWLFIYRNWRD